MRAQRLHRPGPVATDPLRAEVVDDPVPGPGEVLVEVAACGVCRTDLQLVEGDLAARRLPVVPGHQVVGRVLAVGPGPHPAEPPEAGARVGVAWLAGACGACRFCRSGRENLCEGSTFTGWDRDGGFATLLTARSDAVATLPDGPGAPDDVALAPLLCGGVIGYRSLVRSGIRPGQRLGLYGFGASATVVIQVARHWGCEVHVATRSPEEQERARALGAAWAGGATEPPPVPLDAAITFAPVGDVVVAALRAVDRGGTVAVNAIHLDRVPEFPYELLWWERNLCSVANVTHADVTALLALAAEIPIVTQTQVYGLDDAGRALADLAAGRVRGAAVLDVAGVSRQDPASPAHR